MLISFIINIQPSIKENHSIHAMLLEKCLSSYKIEYVRCVWNMDEYVCILFRANDLETVMNLYLQLG